MALRYAILGDRPVPRPLQRCFGSRLPFSATTLLVETRRSGEPTPADAGPERAPRTLPKPVGTRPWPILAPSTTRSGTTTSSTGADDGTCLLYIDRHLVHEVTSPQAFEGLRVAGRKVRAPEKTLAVVDHNIPTERPPRRHRGPGIAHPGRDAGQERARFRHRVFRRARYPPGHRAHDRARAGLHAARHDHRLRRQPHLHARRLRGARARHRHLRGRACARHPDADPEEGEEHAGHRRRQAAARRHRRRTSSSPIIGETGTAGGTGHVIEYAGEVDPRAVDGRPHDGLQHVDRGRRPRRHGGAGREDLRLSEGPAEGAEGRGLGRGRALLGDACPRTRARISTRSVRLDAAEPAAARDLGHEPGGRGLDHRHRARSRR